MAKGADKLKECHDITLCCVVHYIYENLIFRLFSISRDATVVYIRRRFILLLARNSYLR